MGTNPLTAEEKELVDRFYDAACDFRSESFTQVATRVLGAAGFTGGHAAPCSGLPVNIVTARHAAIRSQTSSSQTYHDYSTTPKA
jgi:hypothetical protein